MNRDDDGMFLADEFFPTVLEGTPYGVIDQERLFRDFVARAAMWVAAHQPGLSDKELADATGVVLAEFHLFMLSDDG